MFTPLKIHLNLHSNKKASYYAAQVVLSILYLPSILCDTLRASVSNPASYKEHKKNVIGKPEFVEVPPPPVSKELKRRWSYFIRKVYETDPLVCPKCSGEMRIISFIDQRDVIRKILEHLGL